MPMESRDWLIIVREGSATTVFRVGTEEVAREVTEWLQLRKGVRAERFYDPMDKTPLEKLFEK